LISVEQIFDFWNWFFHEPESLFPLAVFRAAFGVLILLKALLLIPVVPRHLATDAVVDFARFEKFVGRRRLNLLNVLPATTASVYLLIGLTCVAGVCIAIGFWTRVASIVAFLAIASLHHRNSSIFHGGDTVIRIMCFLMIFSPSSAGWSLDAWLAGKWESAGDPWCLRLMQIQVSIIYARTVFWKLRGTRWRNGTAAFYPINCDAYTRFRLPEKLMSPLFIKIATWGTLVVESSLGSIIWIEECRFWVVLAGVLLHLQLEYIMNLQLFGWTMIACLLLFL
jgi:uncharacterized membrane protein YphA (DoxX/SURF4 family)